MAAMADSTGEEPVSFLSLEASLSTSEILRPRPPQMSSNLEPSPFRQQPKVLSDSALPVRSLFHEYKTPLFHCPSALARSTQHGASPRNSTTLSGLAQHVESGACGEGSATLKKAMEFVQEHLDKMGLGTIHLLE